MDLPLAQKMKQREAIKDAVMSLSLANLCFIITWNDLLNSPIRRFSECLAIIINVLLFGALFWVAITLARLGGQLPLRIARLLFPLVLLLPLNAFINILAPSMMPLSTFIILGLALALLGLFEIMPWYHHIVRVAEIAVIVLFPFFLIATFQAAWSLFNRPPESVAPMLTTGTRPSQRVLWLLFDEMDQNVAFSNRPATLSLHELDRLRGQAIYATNVFAPSDSTVVSVPALISGKLLSKTELVSQSRLMITFADSEKPVNWGSQQNLFSRAREGGFNTTLIGWHLPYCSLIGGSLTTCSWIDTERVTLGESISKQIENLICTVPVASRFLIAGNLAAHQADDRRRSVASYIDTLEAAKKAIADPNFGLVLVHWPVPHPPGIYDRRKDDFAIDGGSGYLDNLQLVDKTVGELRRAMEDAGTWENTTVLLTSDHWWRTEVWRSTEFWTNEDANTVSDDADHTVPFILKLAGQQQAETYEPAFNNILTHDLLLALLGGELSSSESVVHWLDQHRSIGESPYRFNLPK